MSDLFRTSDAHAADIRAVVDLLDQRWPGPHFLVGTSRGTVSTAYLGTALDDPRIRGLVLTASLVARPRTRPELRSLRDLPLERITLPVPFAHHRDDGCGATQFDDAMGQFQRHRPEPAARFRGSPGWRSAALGPLRCVLGTRVSRSGGRCGARDHRLGGGPARARAGRSVGTGRESELTGAARAPLVAEYGPREAGRALNGWLWLRRTSAVQTRASMPQLPRRRRMKPLSSSSRTRRSS